MTVDTTPLLSLDAVVLDTETTGLDAQTAQLVQIGAIRIVGAEIVEAESFECLVNPGVPIPAAATAIHGIADADVQDAPRFGAVAPLLAEFCRTAVVIGHAVAYDLAVLQREHDRAGLAWQTPRTLDVRELARVAAPELAHYDLDRLCAWLGISIAGRHTAMGDAQATARVFAALLPLLRQQNVRTVAEADNAVRRLLERDASMLGGLRAPPSAADVAQTAFARLDSFPYRHRVHEVMSAPPVTATPATPVIDAARLLIERKVSSVFVVGEDGQTGIVTEHDLLRLIAERGDDALRVPLGDIMSMPLQSVRADDFLHRAIGRMDRLGFRHLAVRDHENELVGALTMRNLLRQRATTAIVLGDGIDSARTVSDLGRAWGQLPLVAQSLLDDDVDARRVAALISAEIVALTRRAAEMAEARMLQDGHGAPPVPYCVLVLGSAGRGESLLAADQDNAVIFERGEPGGPEDRWFEAAAQHMCAILDSVGVPFCKGGVMASNAQWRHSVQGWRAVVDGWIRRQRPEDLLNVDIFFDGLPVYGAMSLGHAIWRHAYDVAARAPDFVKMLSLGAREWTPPLNWFGRPKTDAEGRIDLKRAGLMPIVVTARALSIRHGVQSRATPERLRGIAGKGGASSDEIEGIVRSHGAMLRALLRQQLADARDGVSPSSRVELRSLGRASRAAFHEMFNGALAASRMSTDGIL
jgi:DNA polymerase-3 subunit epsilon/CBS domain-containing protein